MLLIDKPKGITSHDVVDFVRALTKEKKVGHAGTLDPLATGLLIVLVGKNETKQQEMFMKQDKDYIATVRLGEAFDTDDIEGKLIDKKECACPFEQKIKNALAELVGENLLPVPVYSAIKQKGKPLYEKARAGESFKPPKRKMTVYEANFIKMQNNRTNKTCEIEIFFSVASGVYIRSLAVKLGELLGCPASVSDLRRIRIGKYKIEEAKTLDELKKLVI